VLATAKRQTIRTAEVGNQVRLRVASG
jgi:hypothetical protein